MSSINKMMSVSLKEYGISGIEIKEVEKPKCGPSDILVKVHASAMNPYDWHQMTGTPYLTRLGNSPEKVVLGVDFSGVIEEVGEQVTQYSVGDEIFGFGTGVFSEYALTSENRVAKKPLTMSFEEAASIPIAAITALQGLTVHGNVKPGQHVLINGASGGVGIFAVQLARYFAANVTGVSSTKNTALVASNGANSVIDYTHRDYTDEPNKYDLILDCVGNKSLNKIKSSLRSSGVYIPISGPKNKYSGPLLHWLKTLLFFKIGNKKSTVFIARETGKDLELIADLYNAGVIKPIIQSVHSLDNIVKAFEQIESGPIKGKIVIKIK